MGSGFQREYRFLFEVNKCRLLFLIVHDAPTVLVDAGLSFRQNGV